MLGALPAAAVNAILFLVLAYVETGSRPVGAEQGGGAPWGGPWPPGPARPGPGGGVRPPLLARGQ